MTAQSCMVCDNPFCGAAPPEWGENICRQCARWAAPLLSMPMPALLAERYHLGILPIRVSASRHHRDQLSSPEDVLCSTKRL